MTLPATSGDAIEVQFFDEDAAIWRVFTFAHDLGTILRTRRFARPPGLTSTAKKWRVVKVGDADLTGATIALDAVKFWVEGAALGPVELWNFDFDVDTQRYLMLATPGNIDVYKDGLRRASIATPWTDAQLSLVTRVQELDTFIGFHPQTPPLRITRQGWHDEWDSRDAAFTHIPLFDYTGAKAGGVNEVQQISFDSYAEGETFNITLEDFTTDPIAYTATAGTMAARLSAALEALDNVGAGGVSVTSTGADLYQVEFVGDNAAEDVGQLVPVTIHSTDGGVFAATLTQGQPGGEPVISAARGWPACGAFYQQRLYMGGLGSQPQTVLGSVIGDFFNFDTKGRPAAAAINEVLDTDEAVVIRALYPGRHLQVFTSSAEFYFPTEPIVPPAGIKQSTRRGILPGTPIGFMDGASVFVSRTGQGLCKFEFDQTEQNYSSSWLNVLAPDLVSGVVGMAFRRALGPKETDRALLVRNDGLLAVMMALLDQNVVGFSRWSTRGSYLAAAADLAGDMHVAVLRTFGGVADIYLEKVDPAALTDHETRLVVDGAPATTLQLPAWLAGETLSLVIDGADAGDVVAPADGLVTLPWPALRQVAGGCNHVPLIKSLPLATTEDPRPAIEREMRIGQIAVLLGPTAGLHVGIEGAAHLWPVPLKRRGQGATLDAADAATPFEGWTGRSEIPGFAEEQAVVLTQLRPGPLSIRQLVVTVDT